MASGDFGGDPVVTIDVNALETSTGTRKVLAAQKLYASDFAGSGRFPLKFDALPGYRSYEYRVYWHGKGRVWQTATKLYDPFTSACTW
jgi:hypothetical protein